MLEVCGLFFIFILQGVTAERVPQVSEETLNFEIWKDIETVLDYGDFWSWIYCVFCIIWLQECRWFESEWPLKAHIFQFLVIRFGHNFRGDKRCVLTLLKGRCGHVGERVSMEVGFVVSKASARLSMSQFLPLEGPKALSYSTSYCLHSTKLPVMMVMD